jgi:flagellar motor switch protein FliM
MASLAESERDALMAALAAAGAAPGRGTAEARRRVRAAAVVEAAGEPEPYDFRKSTRFSNEQLRSLLRMHDHMATLLRTYLAAYLRVPVSVSPADVTATTYEEYMEGLGSATLVAVIDLPPLRGRALLTMEYGLFMAIIDRLLGGPGLQESAPRAPTEIEVRVLRRAYPIFLEAFQQAYTPLAPLRPALDSIETNSQFLRLVSPSEAVVSAQVTLGVGPLEGRVGYCLPYPLLEPVLPRLSVKNLASGGGDLRPDPEAERYLTRHIAQARVPVVAEFGQIHLTMRALRDLEVGDVISLDQGPSDVVTVRVAGVPKFVGRPGVRNRRVAVMIEQVLDTEIDVSGREVEA